MYVVYIRNKFSDTFDTLEEGKTFLKVRQLFEYRSLLRKELHMEALGRDAPPSGVQAHKMIKLQTSHMHLRGLSL